MKQLAIVTILILGFFKVVAAEKMNVLILNVDDLKTNLGCYGDKMAVSPNIDALARRGTVMLSNYCQQAVCAPSRISTYTGMRPDSTGILDLATQMRDINPDIITMPEYFKANGYQSIGFGKTMHGAPNDDGTRSWSDYTHSSDLPYSTPKPVFDKYQSPEIHKAFMNLPEKKRKQKNQYALMKQLKKSHGFPATEAYDLPDEAYSDGAIAKAGIQTLKSFADSGEAFYMVLGFKKPHLPFNAPKKYWDLYDREAIDIHPHQSQSNDRPKYAYHSYGELGAYKGYSTGAKIAADQQKELIHGYYACMSYVDAQIGKVMATLTETGLINNTVVVLWGDHGWHLGDHGLWCKHSNFEQATKAPLIIYAPKMPSKQTTTSPTEFIDIFPTVCELAGLEQPEQLEGKSLVPLLKDPTASVKDYAISQFSRMTREKGSLTSFNGYTLRSGDYRITYWMKPGHLSFHDFSDDKVKALELYHYASDPMEKKNLCKDPEHAPALKSMKSKMLAYFASVNDPAKGDRQWELIQKHSKSNKKKKKNKK